MANKKGEMYGPHYDKNVKDFEKEFGQVKLPDMSLKKCTGCGGKLDNLGSLGLCSKCA